VWEVAARECERVAVATGGDFLVFMPGAYEINRTVQAIQAARDLRDFVTFPLHGELPPEEAALDYERQLRAFFDREPPVLDLVLLGMGDNGHTASLFPGLTALHEQQRWVVAEYVAEVSMWRVTLTPGVLNMAREDLFLVAGTAKAHMLRQVLEGPYAPDERPAQVVHPALGEVFWMVDAAAAGELAAPPG